MGTPAQPWFLQIDKEIPAKITRHLQNLYLGINNHDAAITALKTQLTAASTAKSTTTVINQTSSSSSTTFSFPGFGKINNQTGNTSYAVQTQDNGILLIVDDASPVAVSLNSSVTPPYLFFITNFGAGTATLTPATGTINGSASFAVPQNYLSMVVYDGTNWWASVLLVLPQNTPAVTHEWLASYNSTTGAFTQTQPKATDIANPYTAVSATYAILATDYQIECTANSFTVTLPTAVGITGTIYSIKNSGSGTITLATTASQTIDGQLTQTLTQWDNIVVFSNGANWLIV